MRSLSTIAILALLQIAPALPSSATAQEAIFEGEAALLVATDEDPLELARVARRVGDAVVLQSLVQERSVRARLAAIRVSPWLRGPERALEPLSKLLLGRDAVLVEAAARALLQIVEGFDADVLVRREIARAELTPVRVVLAQAAARTALREDSRALIQLADALLLGLAVPGPPPP